MEGYSQRMECDTRTRARIWLAPVGALLIALASAASASAQTFGLAAAERYTLPNGLEVILSRDDRLPSVAVLMRYDVGSRDDPEGYAGLAHMVEHMTFRGSRHVPELEMLGMLERVGAQRANATTHPDWTSYYSVVPANQVPLILWLESERMAFTLEAMTEEKFQVEQDVVLNEIGGEGSRIPQFLRHALYPPDSVYHRLQPSDSDESAFTLENVRWFYQRWYRPDNATLALVGRFDPERVKREIEKYFAAIQASGEVPPRAGSTANDLVGAAELYVDEPVDREYVSVSWLAPCAIADCGADLLLASEVLSGNTQSVIDRAIVQDDHVSTGVSISLDAYDTHTLIQIRAELQLDVEPERARSALDEVLRRMQNETVDAQTVQQAKISLKTKTIAGFAPLLERAEALANYRSARGREVLYDPNAVLGGISEVTPERVRDAIRRYLPLDRRVVLYGNKNRNAPFRGSLVRQVGSALPSAERSVSGGREK